MQTENYSVIWTKADLEALTRLIAQAKSINTISKKMRRTTTEISEQIERMGLSEFLNLPETTPQEEDKNIAIDNPQEKKVLSGELFNKEFSSKYEQVVSNHLKEFSITQDTRFSKMSENLALIHQDLLGLETKTVIKFDELIKIINKNTKLKEEEMAILREQYAIWKAAHQKNNKTTNQ